jgi:hypothetical protein
MLGRRFCFRLLVHSKRNKEIAPVKQRNEESWHFVAFVPREIEADDNYEPQLVGLPFNILFAGIANDTQTGQQSLVDVCYWPAPETFREDSQRQEMRYFTRPTNDYFVRVIFEKNTGHWQTEKFKGNKLIRTAFGSTLDNAMIHTTMGGPEPDER